MSAHSARARAGIARLLGEVLRGYGQVLFCGRRRSGALVLAATMLWPASGLCGLLGALAAATTGLLLPARDVISAPGLYACNGALTGLAVGVLVPASPVSPLAALAAGVMAAQILFALSGPLARLGLPPLSLPFVLATWMMLAVTGLAPGAPVETGGDVRWSAHVLGMAVFRFDFAVGALAMAAVFLHGRGQGLLMMGSLPAAIVAAQAAGAGAVGALNVALTVVALGAVFMPRQVWPALFGAMSALGITVLLGPLHVPLLVAPFNIATLGILLLARRKAAPREMVIGVPFFGRWKVSQGPDGAYTHQGEGRHAWDFVVTDETGRTHRGLGLHPDDYYAFGLPVAAPVDGVVVAALDGVPDNLPPRENFVAPWGNYLIIEQAPGVFVEISHFQQGSMVVRPGQSVKRGQVLGRCGNSGRSLEPHIHVQVQTGAYLGAPSVPTRFTGCRGGPRAPRQDELVEAVA
ncbi:MAG: hypothetical protein FJX76_08470 [Armatimonadetes bacterium]|nr:hypothetical protein [Armatimonadota bacterium]